MTDGTFLTGDGLDVAAVTADEMRAVDRVAVEEFGLELLQMMENAGRTLARHVRRSNEGSVVVVAGNGGNGGGGLACARHLANRGVDVEVVLDRDPSGLDGAAAHQFRTLREMGVPHRVGAGDPLDAGTVVDALVGYGLTGALRGAAESLARAVNKAPGRVVSLDVPTGRDATTGQAHGVAVDPDRVVTLALPKTGLRSIDARLFLADISVPAGVYERLDVEYENPFEESYVTELVVE